MNDSDLTQPVGEPAGDATAVHPSDPVQDSPQPAASAEVAVNPAEFPTLDEHGGSDGRIPLDRFYDVTVHVWAELGRVTLPIGELLQLGEGSVIKLPRAVSDPIDLVAQGVQFARGEVVVVDDCFAVRITEIDSDRVPDG